MVFAMNTAKKHCSSSHNRRGAAAVEFALTAGLAFFFFFAALEFCRVAMIRHTVENALYEGARAGIVPGATAANVTNRAQQILGTLGLRNVTIQVTPNPIVDTTQNVSIRIQVPLNRNLFGPAKFFSGQTVDRTFQMQREGA